MRLGKRERASAKAQAAVRLIARHRAREPEPGKYASMWDRIDPILRPVSKPPSRWEWHWQTARRIKMSN